MARIKKFKELKNTDEMIKDIVSKVGSNSTGSGKTANEDIEFPEVTLSDGSKSFSFYTYKGDVCILDDQGMDVDFTEYSIEDQNLLYNSIMK